jgi:hypothetical protein
MCSPIHPNPTCDIPFRSKIAAAHYGKGEARRKSSCALAFPLTNVISPRLFYQIPPCRVVRVRGEPSERRSPVAAVATAVVHSRILQAQKPRASVGNSPTANIQKRTPRVLVLQSGTHPAGRRRASRASGLENVGCNKKLPVIHKALRTR